MVTAAKQSQLAQSEPVKTETVSLSSLQAELSGIPLFASLGADDLLILGEVERFTYPAGVLITTHLLQENVLWVLLGGALRVERIERDDSRTVIMKIERGESFGETALLRIKPHDVRYDVFAEEESVLIRFNEASFWHMMNCCPGVREAILHKAVQRLKSFTAETMHREKLISLGTMAAGLMHELHNPGAAARRASSQLRANIVQLQQLSLKFCDMDISPAQAECMGALQELAFRGQGCCTAMNTLDQADAEEAMGAWLESAGVENAWKIAPALVSVGMRPEQLTCARTEFAVGFSEALNWLESLISSVTLVGSIEESITRISDLVGSVKRYAYNDSCAMMDINVHEGLASTLTLLGHKLRQRQVEVVKHFDAQPATIQTRGSALTQVWMNLLDNAMDAAPAEGGRIEISTRNDGNTLVVTIADNGGGIPDDVRERIFEPFFTTKPLGKGTGLGLEIAHRIITQKYRGQIQVNSRPGRTEFEVRLPQQSVSA